MENINNVINKVDNIKLSHSFYDACSNEEFKKYVDSLSIEEEILMKYTSSLEDSFKEYINCSKCSGLEKCKNSHWNQFKFITKSHIASIFPRHP